MTLPQTLTWLLSPPGSLILPLGLAVVMAVGDIRTRRIPNYLTLGGAVAGLVFQTVAAGWPGLQQGLGGLALGFGLMLPFYIFFGMGAGDVKAMAALGAWLTPWSVLSLFLYMALAGGVLGLVMLIWSGSLWRALRSGWIWLANLVLTRGRGALTPGEASPSVTSATMPYGVAIAVGMAMLLIVGPVL